MNHLRKGHALVATQREDVRSRLAAIVDSSDDAIISKNLDGVISTWNAAAARLFGYSESEAVGQPITLIIPADLRDEEHDILKRLRAGERIEHYETRRVTRDGRFLDVSLTVSPLRDSAGRIVGAAKILRDITESKRVHTALRESERRLASEVAGVRTLQSISTRLISELTQESLFSQILDAAMELMASDAASVQMLASDGQSLILLGCKNLHPESGAFWARVTAEAGSTCGGALRDNQRVVVSDVESCAFMAGTRDLEEYRRSRIRAVQSTPLQSREGRPIGMISTHWRTPHTPTEDDLTLFDVLSRQAADLIERTRTESALRESEDALARVSRRLLHAQDEEGARIARELHDDIGQRLAVLNFSLDALLRGADFGSRSRRSIEEARKEVNGLAKDVHAFSHRLHPARLEYLGIAKAAATLCGEIAGQHDVQVCFHADSVPERLSKRVSVGLYRVLQEALRNAIKHSGTRKIDVSLRGGGDQVELTVADCGAGFDAGVIGGVGLGLTSMKERVRALDGEIAILSRPQHGTTVRVRVPLLKD